jgi:carboxypeptidase Q
MTLLLVCAPLFAQSTVQRDAERLMAAALNDSHAYDTLSYLTDNIGARLSGSRGAELAVKWTTDRFRSWGIDVRTEKFMVPRWVRGIERARLVSHNDQKVVLTALGGSVATPPDGITANVVRVTSLQELKALGRKNIAGRIVFFDKEMDLELVRSGRAFEAYGKAVEFRGSGADAASEYGAVAAVVRSVASGSLRTPHTGGMRYRGKFKKIPAAAITTEDADLIRRLLANGERVRMSLVLTPRTLPDVESANVVAEIRGTTRPDEVVLIGGHLDSWDLGTGAVDNGSGIAMVMETMRLIKTLDLRPSRTIRCVLYMNEENGLRGGRDYAKRHAAELAKHIAAIESDAGVAEPLGFRTTIAGDPLIAFVSRIEPILRRVGATQFQTAEGTGADTGPLIDAGVTGFGYMPDGRKYFEYHHTPADTLDKVDPHHLAQGAAAIAALTWFLSESTEELQRPAPRRRRAE